MLNGLPVVFDMLIRCIVRQLYLNFIFDNHVYAEDSILSCSAGNFTIKAPKRRTTKLTSAKFQKDSLKLYYIEIHKLNDK